MNPLLIQGGRIMDPGRDLDETGGILIRDGRIAWIGKGEESPSDSNCDIINAKNLVVCPGFIDLHCHLRQPGFEDKETIATGSQSAAHGGFTTICCMPNTNPALDNSETIEFVKAEAAKVDLVRVLPIGCVTKDRAGKELVSMSALSAAGVIGFSDDGSSVLNTALMIRALRECKLLGLPVIEHCEQTGLAEGGVMNSGGLAVSLGLKGMPAVAEEIIVSRDISLAEMTGSWVHIAHVSTEKSVEFIRQAKKAGVHVTAEVTPHHLTMTEEQLAFRDPNAKVNPPLRTQKDVEALIRGLKEGVIDIIATDHAPHTPAEKAVGIEKAPSGIIGFETALGSLMGLVHNGQLDLKVLISRLTIEPAKILGNRHGRLGTLSIGALADVTIFDPDREWLVDPDKFASKGRNTPLAGTMLKGQIMATISGGKIVFKDDSVRIEEKKEKKR